MAATATDKLKKLSRRWVGQIGAGGVADGSTQTIPLSSVTNLATDTAVVATIDRVDANGVPTPSLEETVIGVVSGSNLTNCIREAEGTAQAHNAGAVVEILVTAKGWNDLVDWGLVEHNQDGTHKETALDSMITGTEAQGDIIYHNGTVWTRLPKGTDGQILTQASNVPTWANNNAGASVIDEDNSGGSSTSSSTFANITGADVSVTTTSQPNILLIATIQAFANPGAVSGSVDYEIVWHDGSSTIGPTVGMTMNPSNVRKTLTISHVVTGVTAGAHSYTVQHRSVNNTLSCTAEVVNLVAVAIS